MELRPFDVMLAPLVSTWARSVDEVQAWCSRTDVPVPAAVIADWGARADVSAYGLHDGADLVGYGELWVDDDESEVELARLIVAPDRRGRGVGRQLTRTLAELARGIHPAVFLRVRPDNEVAIRCYAAVGFQRVAPDEEAAWNAGQPASYAWFGYAPTL